MDTVEGKRNRETGQNLVRFFLHLLLLSIVASATAKWLILETITAGRLRFRLLWCTHVWCLCRCCYSVSTKSEFPILKHSAADDSRPRSTVRPWFNLEQSAFLLLLLFAHFAFALLLKQLQTLCFPFPFASDFITLIILLKSATFLLFVWFLLFAFFIIWFDEQSIWSAAAAASDAIAIVTSLYWIWLTEIAQTKGVQTKLSEPTENSRRCTAGVKQLCGSSSSSRSSAVFAISILQFIAGALLPVLDDESDVGKAELNGSEVRYCFLLQSTLFMYFSALSIVQKHICTSLLFGYTVHWRRISAP